MKIEQLLVQHFYNNKTVSLQGMGTFNFSPGFVLPQDNDKDGTMPEGAVSFEYNPRVSEDEALIDFIVQQTRKIKPLASADLDSYLVLGKQFLNIGKPFRIEGLGFLEKNQQGEYEFTQGMVINSKLEAAPAQLREKHEEDISFATTGAPPNENRKGLLIAAVVVILGLLAWGTWYMINRKPKESDTIAATPIIEDTLKKVVPVMDTTRITATPGDGYTFKVVFKETTNKAEAISKMNTLINRGHKVVMLTTDSVNFKLAEPFTLPLSDTARIKDSLNKFYYLGKAYIQLN